MKARKIAIYILAVIFLITSVNAVLIEGAIIIIGETKPVSEWIKTFPDESESTLSRKLAARNAFLTTAGAVNRLQNKKMVNSFYKLENGHIMNVQHYADMACSADAAAEVNKVCKSKGVPFVYVTLPSKKESKASKSYGIESFLKESNDLFVEQLKERDVSCLDMRKYLKSPTNDPMDIFYKTDHHWTTLSALSAAQTIADHLNDTYDTGLDTSSISTDKFNIEHMENCWTGEYGSKLSYVYSGFDDFDLITPKDPGSFTFIRSKNEPELKGDFSIMLNKSTINSNNKYIDNMSMYYTYLSENGDFQVIDNLKERKGNILLIKDSFSLPLGPFLAVSADKVTLWDVRYNNDDLKKHITETDYDAVIIIYSSSNLTNDIHFDSSMFLFKGIND